MSKTTPSVVATDIIVKHYRIKPAMGKSKSLSVTSCKHIKEASGDAQPKSAVYWVQGMQVCINVL